MRWILSILLALASTLSIGQKVVHLHDGWKYTATDSIEWQPAEVPGVVHLDLLRNELIPDPYYRNNEKELQWIEKKDWIYELTFNVDTALLRHEHIEIVFEGLDTYAEVSLNENRILSADNMFRSWRTDIREYLKLGKNTLTVQFESPLNRNKLIASQEPKLPAANETVDLRVSPFTRKAAYHFGWDWGPRFVTSGIWRPVYLECWNDLIVRYIHYTTHQLDEYEAQVDVEMEVEADEQLTYLFEFGEDKHLEELRPGLNKISHSYRIEDYVPWNPRGYGEQRLYPTPYAFSNKQGKVLEGSVDIAIRNIELVHQPDEIGTSFYFNVNDRPIFMKGANYIPQDLFLPRVDSSQYRRLLQQVADANMNMLRVWGGGIYENDYFYDLCDSLGILVWQDFMFANSMYPDSPQFLENVGKEVEENVRRLQNHPCIAVWCGNNEIEVAWNNWGWQKQYGYSYEDSARIWNTYKNIFHELIPLTLKRMDPSAPYTSTSPLSNWGKAENFNHASMHYWGVWHGGDPIEAYQENVGRFNTEYGYQSFPEKATLLKAMTEADLDLESEVMLKRQKSYIGNGIVKENVIKYCGEKATPENLGMNEWIYNTQRVQAKAYDLAIRSHRLSYPHAMGSLFWQLNDCWPGPSWSVIDYYGTPKISYEAVTDAFSPIVSDVKFEKGEILVRLFVDGTSPQAVLDRLDIKNEKGKIIYSQNRHFVLFPYQKQTMLISDLDRKTKRLLRKKKASIEYIIRKSTPTESTSKWE